MLTQRARISHDLPLYACTLLTVGCALCVWYCTVSVVHCVCVVQVDDQWPCAWRPDDLAKALRARELIRQRGEKPVHKRFDDDKFCAREAPPMNEPSPDRMLA